MQPWGLALALFFATSACGYEFDASTPQGSPQDRVNANGADPMVATRIPVRARAALRENSGAAMSVAQPGVLFTINDSGHEPQLFAIDTAGNDRGAWAVVGAANRDWEAIAMGPCGSSGASAAELAPPSCLYIGDVGDNDARRRAGEIYRLPEPRAANREYTGTVTPERLTFRFEDGPRDVEAMYVGPNGTVYLITKRPLRARDGRMRPARVYAIPPSAWEHAERSAIAAFADSIPLVPGAIQGGLITDATLSPDGHFVAVRTYGQVYTFVADSASGRIRTTVRPTICNVVPLRERQGEGITWNGGSRKLILTSEGRSSPLHLIACPLPGE